MEKSSIFGDLIVTGNLICAGSGTLLARGAVQCTFGAAGVSRAELIEQHPGSTVIRGNLDLEGKEIRVDGNVFIWGKMLQEDGWNGRVAACCKAAGEPEEKEEKED